VGNTIFIHIEKSVLAAPPEPSARVLEVAMMFGLGIDDSRVMTIVPPADIPLRPGAIVFITGPSGGGKSTLLRLIAQQCRDRGRAVIEWSEPTQPTDAADRDDASVAGQAHAEPPLVDVIGSSVAEATSLLSLVGLGDAFVMLRRASELSDGQRARFRLAQMIAAAGSHADGAVLIADEFLATLDRLTAQTVAANVRRWISRTPHTFIAATTHDDLLEPLAPDVLVFKGLGDHVEVLKR
jgi:ABC-type ATPase with predicted acetyltransferase domain